MLYNQFSGAYYNEPSQIITTQNTQYLLYEQLGSIIHRTALGIDTIQFALPIEMETTGSRCLTYKPIL